MYGVPDPCHVFGGSFTVTVTPVARQLNLNGPATAFVGDSVTFTASLTDGSIPVVQRWIWVADSGDARTPVCTTTGATC